jgi:hypothetical protein
MSLQQYRYVRGVRKTAAVVRGLVLGKGGRADVAYFVNVDLGRRETRRAAGRRRNKSSVGQG